MAEHTKRKHAGGCIKYVLLLCCLTAMLLMGNAATLAKMNWEPDREIRLDDTPIDTAVAAGDTPAKI
jgi:hypothetical protein